MNGARDHYVEYKICFLKTNNHDATDTSVPSDATPGKLKIVVSSY